MKKDIAQRVHERGYCEMCGRGRELEIHHRVPKGMGGSKARDVEENLILLCRTCHDARHHIKSISADGFCCAVCPRDCEFARR